jgi:flagellar export protein FliJ
MPQPRFIFPLQPLLEHRLRLEKDQMRIVSTIQQQANTLITQIQNAQQSIAAENKKLSADHLTGKLNLPYIATEKRYVGQLQMLVASTYQRLAIIDQQLGAAKAQLLIAARARKVLEKLRQKQHARWLAEINRKEAEFLDEIGTQLALRKMLEEQSAS